MSETATPPNRSQLPSATSNLGEAVGGSKGSGLSSGAKAGIGVGVGVGTLLVALAGFLLYKRRVGRREKMPSRTAVLRLMRRVSMQSRRTCGSSSTTHTPAELTEHTLPRQEANGIATLHTTPSVRFLSVRCAHIDCPKTVHSLC